MLEQPRFGQHLKRLRHQRGLSQAALAGKGMSTTYLSRLESGLRRPTERAVTYLAEQLGIDASVLLEPPEDPLAQVLASVVSAPPGADTTEVLRRAVENDTESEDPLARWQAVWLLSDMCRRNGDQEAARMLLPGLVELSDEMALPDLRLRARVRYAVSLRTAGALQEAMPLAVEAFEIARDHELSVEDTATALMALISLEAEAATIEQARAHVAILDELLDGMPNNLRAEALWTGAIVCLRQSDNEEAIRRLETALELLDSADDVLLWSRIRLAAVSANLQMNPPSTAAVHQWLDQAETALTLCGTPLHRQEATYLRACLAFEEGQYERAAELHTRLESSELRLSYRDRVRLQVLGGRLSIVQGDLEKGIETLERLGREATDNKNPALAAQIWQSLALGLADVQKGRPGGGEAQ
jgi:transcriptional regulator with XRE-family HTH domain